MSTKSSKIIEIEVGRKNPYQLEVTRQDIEMCGLPPSMHGTTFAHITDIHAGFADLEKVYAEAMAQVNASESDYIFFTGDYVDRRTDKPNYPMVELLQSFRARREVFGCLGNHEIYAGAEDYTERAEPLDVLRALGSRSFEDKQSLSG